MEIGAAVTVDVAIKLFDLGDSSIPIEKLRSPEDRSPVTPEREAAERSARSQLESVLTAQGKELNDLPDPLVTKLSSIDVAGDMGDENQEDNHADVSVRLLPSRNVPPRIKVMSPAPDAVLFKRADSPFELEIVVEAFDLDGYIEKVMVNAPFYQARPFVEDGQYKFLYMGQKYTGKELEEHWKANPPPEILAVKTGPKTYTFTATSVEYGANLFDIVAVDNGGRRERVYLDVVVKASLPAPAK